MKLFSVQIKKKNIGFFFNTFPVNFCILEIEAEKERVRTSRKKKKSREQRAEVDLVVVELRIC